VQLEGFIVFGFAIISFLGFGALAVAVIMIVVAAFRALLRKKRKRSPDLGLAEGLKDLIRAGKAEEALQAYQKFTGYNEQQARIELQRLVDTLETENQQIK